MQIKKIIGVVMAFSVCSLLFTMIALDIGLLSATVVVSFGIILAGVLMKGVDMMYP